MAVTARRIARATIKGAADPKLCEELSFRRVVSNFFAMRTCATKARLLTICSTEVKMSSPGAARWTSRSAREDQAG